MNKIVLILGVVIIIEYLVYISKHKKFDMEII